jgi:hypothetical protein
MGAGTMTEPAALCECGHPIADHAESGWGPNTVCVARLATFPDGGFHGVCPCVRRIECPVCCGAGRIPARGVLVVCPMCKGNGSLLVDDLQTEPVPWVGCGENAP